MENIFENISKNVPRAENEYMGEDGLLHCSACHRNTQTVVEVFGIRKTVRCICDCRKKELDARMEQERQEEQARQRRICFEETNMAGWTFGNDDRRNETLSNAMQNYVKHFTDFKKDGMGLLLYGPVGTGKTYYAAAIANALIDKGYKVKMTKFTTLANQLWNAENKQAFMNSLNRYSLLVIDDLGAERQSDYMKEQVFNVIDNRYMAGLPFVVTTNLTADEIKKPHEVGYQRIYDRVLERCHPIAVNGTSRRKQSVKESYHEINTKLGL